MRHRSNVGRTAGERENRAGRSLESDTAAHRGAAVKYSSTEKHNGGDVMCTLTLVGVEPIDLPICLVHARGGGWRVMLKCSNECFKRGSLLQRYQTFRSTVDVDPLTSPGEARGHRVFFRAKEFENAAASDNPAIRYDGPARGEHFSFVNGMTVNDISLIDFSFHRVVATMQSKLYLFHVAARNRKFKCGVEVAVAPRASITGNASWRRAVPAAIQPKRRRGATVHRCVSVQARPG